MKRGTKDGNFYSQGKVKREERYYKLEGELVKFYPLSNEEMQEWNVEKRKYNYHQQHYMCMECSREYNREIFPLCPSCWKMECRKCHAKVPWRANKETYCVECGHDRRDAVHVWCASFRLYGKMLPSGSTI